MNELTEDEIKVLDRLARGFMQKELPKELGWSAGTISRKQQMIFRKLGADKLQRAIIVALEQGYRFGGLRLDNGTYELALREAKQKGKVGEN